MAVEIINRGVDLKKVAAELRELEAKGVVIGVVAEEDSTLAKLAGANEFGAIIRPKNGKYLAIPVSPSVKGKSPRDVNNLVFRKAKKGGLVAGRQFGDTFIMLFVLLRETEIPERSFLRSTGDDPAALDKALRLAKVILEKVFFNQATAEMVLIAIGESMASSVKERIVSNIPPGNSALTSSMKDSEKTLMDSGRLLGAIWYEIV